MSIRHIQGLLVLAKHYSLRTRPGQGVLRKPDVNALDLLILRCVNRGNAVRVRVRHKKACAPGIRSHCCRVAVNGDVLSNDVLAAQRNHRHRGIIPTRHVRSGVLAASQHHDAVRVNVFGQLSGMVQIHSLHPSRPAEPAHNRHAVSQVVRRHQCGAVRRYRQPGRVQCRLSVVVVRPRNFICFAQFERGRFYFRIRPRRSRLHRCRCFRIKTKDPHFVLKSAGNVHFKVSISARGR